MIRKYFPFLLVFTFLTTSIWWDLIRYVVRMAFAGALLSCCVFLFLKLTRYALSKYFLLLVFLLFFSLFPGLELCQINNFIHTAPTYIILPFTSVGLFYYILVNKNQKLLFAAIIIATFFMVYSSLATIRADVNASRVFFGNAKDLDGFYAAIDNIESGVFGYAQIHSLPFIAIGLVSALKSCKRRFVKFLIFGMLVLCSWSVFKSGYTTAALCFGGAIALSCVSARNRILLVGAVFLLTIFIFLSVKTGLLLSALETIKPHLDPQSDFIPKIEEFERMQHTSAGSGYWSGRSELYAISWKSFLEAPFFGQKKGGGHSYLLDTLAKHGLFYFILYLSYYILLFRLVLKVLPRDRRFCYLCAGLILVCLLCFKADGLIAQSYCLFLFLPGLLLANPSDFLAASNTAQNVLRDGL